MSAPLKALPPSHPGGPPNGTPLWPAFFALRETLRSQNANAFLALCAGSPPALFHINDFHELLNVAISSSKLPLVNAFLSQTPRSFWTADSASKALVAAFSSAQTYHEWTRRYPAHQEAKQRLAAAYPIAEAIAAANDENLAPFQRSRPLLAQAIVLDARYSALALSRGARPTDMDRRTAIHRERVDILELLLAADPLGLRQLKALRKIAASLQRPGPERALLAKIEELTLERSLPRATERKPGPRV